MNRKRQSIIKLYARCEDEQIIEAHFFFFTYLMAFETIHYLMGRYTLMTKEARTLEAFGYSHRFRTLTSRAILSGIF